MFRRRNAAINTDLIHFKSGETMRGYFPLFRTILCTLLLVAAVRHPLAAQDEPAADTTGPWDKGGKVGLNFTQVGISNWAGGGENTVAIGGLGSLFADYDGEQAHWNGTLEAGYGFTKIEDQEFRKSDDQLALISSYGYEATEHLLYSALLDFRTQFSEGLDYDRIDSATGDPTLISDIFAPAYLNLGLGMAYEPADYVQFFLGPVANRLILVLNDTLSQQGAFGVDPGEKFKSELGALSNLRFKKEIFENVELGSRLNLFAAYASIDKVVVTWESQLNMKVNSWLHVNITADVIYDEKVTIERENGTTGPATQFRNTLGVGVGYAF